MPSPQVVWRPMDPIDRSWSRVGFIRNLVDLDVPAYPRLRDALAALSAAAPEVGCWSSPSPPRWGVLDDADRDAWLEAAIRFVDEPGADAERLFALHEPLGDMPMRLLVGPDWISVRMSHAVGDGQTVNAFLGHLLQRARSDEDVAVPWTTVPARRRDLMIVRDVARHPNAVAWALRNRGLLAGGAYEPAALHADALADTTLVLASRSGFPRELRELRDRWFPGASAAAVAMTGLRAAFAGSLPEPRPGFECLFNTRSNATANAWGNWSAGVYLHPADDYSPQATTAEMTRVRDSGLAGLACASLRLRGRSTGGEAVQVVAREGVPRLTMSYTQQHAMAGIPGVRPGRSVQGTFSRPNGVDTITVQAVELGDRLGLSVSFYPDAWATADVRAAVERFLADPTSCLARSLTVDAGAT